jgi:hypothetical protein
MQADFRLLKSHISLPMIFDYIGGIELRQQGRELCRACPFCKYERSSPKGGNERQRLCCKSGKANLQLPRLQEGRRHH